MKRFFLISSVFFLLLPHMLRAEAGKYIFEHVPASAHWINSIFQDDMGFMWLGTRNGLYRYSGDEYEAIFEGELFYDIQQDVTGRMWVKKRNGYAIYDPKTCVFMTEAETASELGSSVWVEVLQIDPKGNFWWSEGQDVWFCSNAMDSRCHVGRVEGGVYDIYCRNDIAYVLTVEGRLYRYAMGQDGSILSLPMMGPATERPEENADYRFHCVFVDSFQNIWLSQGAQGVWFYPNGSEAGRYLCGGDHPGAIQGGFICSIEEDSDGNIWLASDHGGISVCNRKAQVIARLKNDPRDVNTISGNGVLSLYRDNEDNVWLGYTKNGMSIYRGENKTWSISHLETLHQRNVSDDINAVCEDMHGNVWYGTDGNGLIRKDRRTGHETLYNSGNSALESNVITDIHSDAEGRLWIGTFYGGLSCIEDGRMKTYSYKEDANSLASVNVWSIDHDDSGRIWLGTLGGGLQALDPTTGHFETFSYSGGYLCNDAVQDIACADDGNVYVATAAGLSIVNPHTRTTRFVDDEDKMINRCVTGLVVDSRGLVWLDEDGMLQVYCPVTDSLYTPVHPQMKDVRGFEEDETGVVWVITDSGLCRVKVTTDAGKSHDFDISSFTFPRQDDLHFNQRSACLTSSGDFIIGTFCGYMDFSPVRYAMQSKELSPRLHFTHLYSGNTLLQKALEFVDDVCLEYGHSVVSVKYACLDYFSVLEQDIYYRMEGLSDEWIATDKNADRLTFTNLTPGRYTLTIASDTSDLSDASVLDIRILPPWWATWWSITFYVLSGLSLILLVGLLLKRRSRERQERLEWTMKQERRHFVDEMKIQFFTNVSHDFRTPLTLILTPIEDRLAKEPGLKNDPFIMSIHRNAKRLNDLVTEVLDFRKIEMYGSRLKLASGDFVSTVSDAVSSFRLMAESMDISLEMVSEESQMVFEYDQVKIQKIVTNLLSNSFKYTPKHGSVKVTVFPPVQGKVTVEVADSGRGIPDKDKRRVFERFYQAKGSESGSGIGLHVVREYVLLHGGEIEVKDNDPQGTVFTFTVPVKETPAADVVPGQDTYVRDVPDGGDGRRAVVLVVDDNDDFRTFMVNSLSDEYKVVDASDGAAALKVVESEDIDVVISDVMMPVMDGVEFCRRMKSDINTSHIPVILLTAKAMQEDECHGLESGADDYLTKPFNMSILRLRVAKFIEWKKRSKKLFEKELEITTDQITLTSMDDRLLQQAINVINENISNPDFSVSDLSAALYMHRTSLYKKLVYITGKTPVEFIRAIRLKRAASLLETDGVYVSEVAYMVGFNSPKIFAGHFKDEFGCSPSEYRKRSTLQSATLPTSQEG
ncbi:MAG: response regulator [Bacteroidales bacterium]|nr:response regulator [Bacteroidales bacterium]